MADLKIENCNVLLKVNLEGGSYVDFHFKDLPLNPISWASNDPAHPPFKGHFLCFDRWGSPTPAEKANGIPFHGEVNTQVWKVGSEPESIVGFNTCSMSCTLPFAGLQLTRKIELSEDEPICFITEDIENLNKNGRLFNIVQHVTIAPPFLDQSTWIDNNTEKGYENKMNGCFNQEEPVICWPEATHKGEKISFRQFQNEWPLVASFVFRENDKYGWVTACNAARNLMLGYVWKTEDYPWINFWRSMKEGVPMAFGMEFGTTGLHEPFPVAAKKGRIFDRNIFGIIDAGEVISKSFTTFLAKIPADYQGVETIEISNSALIIREKNTTPRDITYRMKPS